MKVKKNLCVFGGLLAVLLCLLACLFFVQPKDATTASAATTTSNVCTIKGRVQNTGGSLSTVDISDNFTITMQSSTATGTSTQKENGVKYYVIQSVWLIDIDGFMKTIAPKEYDGESTMPRLRCIQTAVVEYSKSHKQQIDKHVVEKCMQSSKVFKYNHGNRWIINYDELEPVIDEFLSSK